MNEKPLWTAVASDANAEPIRIIDLDVAKTTWSRVHESMRVVHLRLNRQPDAHWIRFFHEERESRINARRAGIWIEEGYIAFDCLLHEVETHHMPDIRRSVDFANERSLALVAARLRERGAQAAADRGERLELEQLRKRVRDLVDPRAAAGRAAQFGTAQTPPAPAAPPTAKPAPGAGVDGGVDRRTTDRRTARPVAEPAKAVPVAEPPTAMPVASPVAEPARAVPVASPVAAPTEAPATPAAADAVPQAPASVEPVPEPPRPRSLEATLDDYRAALREARERAGRPPHDPGDTNR
jgi:hypothetical protein